MIPEDSDSTQEVAPGVASSTDDSLPLSVFKRSGRPSWYFAFIRDFCADMFVPGTSSWLASQEAADRPLSAGAALARRSPASRRTSR